jgi:hypothetical protein
MGEDSPNILGIIAGTIGLLSIFFLWWGIYAGPISYGISMGNMFLRAILSAYPPFGILYLTFFIVLTGGTLLGIGAGTLKKGLSMAGFILLIVGVASTAILSFVLVALSPLGIPLFNLDPYVGFGPGFFMGIASIILGIFAVRSISRDAL